jgi:hypothetical protein
MVGMLFLTACWPPTSQPSTQAKAPADQAAVGIEPQVSLNAVMVALVDHAAHNLWNVERKDGNPMTDADWEVVSTPCKLLPQVLRLRPAAPARAMTGGRTLPPGGAMPSACLEPVSRHYAPQNARTSPLW